MSLCDFVAVTRPGYDRGRLYGDIREIKEKYSSRIHFMEVPALAISSSDIRARENRGEPIKYLLPQAVEDYIHKFCLYRDNEKDEVKFMLDINTMQEKLQSALSIKRYIHTMGVADEAERLAEIYGTKGDRKKARIAGLLHDCAKDFPPEMRERFCKEYKVPVDEYLKKVPELIHPFLGAEVARREYLVTDEEILGAIRFHTTGKPNMTLMEKIIYIADYIEPNRETFDGLEEARRLAYLDLNMALKYILEQTIEYIKAKGKTLHPLSLEAYEYYKKY